MKTVQQAYSTDFFIKDFAENLYAPLSKSRKLYTNILNAIQANKLKIKVDRKGFQRLEQLKNTRNNSELEQAKLELVISLIQRGSIQFLSDEGKLSDCLDAVAMQTSKKKKFSAAAKEDISTVFCDSMFVRDQESKVGACLKMALLNKSAFNDGSFEYLFEVQELEPIKKGASFKWYEYLKPYGIHTNRVLIRDPYFFKNSMHEKLNRMIGPLLTASYSTPIKVEIISDLAPFNERAETSKKRVLKWINKHDSRLNISCRYQRGSASAEFHDRYLFTDYWVLKVPAGLDIEKNGKAHKYTNPTLVGRYAPNGSSWDYINENWEYWKHKKCKPINN